MSELLPEFEKPFVLAIEGNKPRSIRISHNEVLKVTQYGELHCAIKLDDHGQAHFYQLVFKPNYGRWDVVPMPVALCDKHCFAIDIPGQKLHKIIPSKDGFVLRTTDLIPKAGQYIALDFAEERIYHINPRHEAPQITSTELLDRDGVYCIVPDGSTVYRIVLTRDDSNRIVAIDFVQESQG